MLESTTIPNQEQYTSCTNVQGQEAKQDYGRNLETTRIDGTPFTMVIDNHRNVEENCFLAMGEHRITEWNSHDKLQTMIETKDWTLIANSTIQWVINILTTMNENKKIEQKIKTDNKTI